MPSIEHQAGSSRSLVAVLYASFGKILDDLGV